MRRLFALVLMAGVSSASADDLADRAAVCFSCPREIQAALKMGALPTDRDRLHA